MLNMIFLSFLEFLVLLPISEAKNYRVRNFARGLCKLKRFLFSFIENPVQFLVKPKFTQIILNFKYIEMVNLASWKIAVVS